MSGMYVMEEALVEGPLASETVQVVRMSRERFMELVEEALDDAPVRERLERELRETAQAMERFPVQSWMNERGCGCVVGEYLVRTGQERALLARQQDDDRIRVVLRGLTGDMQLYQFGLRLDTLIGDEVSEGDWEDLPDVVLIEDGVS